MPYYVQKNTTLSKEQLEFLKVNKDNMSVGEIAKMLGIGYNKAHNNLKLLGLYSPRTAKVIKMEGFFDVEDFAKFYKY